MQVMNYCQVVNVDIGTIIDVMIVVQAAKRRSPIARLRIED